MLPTLAPGSKYTSHLAERLSSLAIDASNTRTVGAAGALLDKYLTFADEAARQLTGVLTGSAIDQLILTDPYWRAHSVLNLEQGNRIAQRELQATQGRLERAAEAIRRQLAVWPRCDVVVVPDTNILMQGTGGTVCSADWHELGKLSPNENLAVVLLQAVIDELDKHKSSTNKVTRRLARRALIEIDDLFTESAAGVVQIRSEEFVSRGGMLGANVHLIVAVEPTDHVRLGDGDAEIIDRALATAAKSQQPLLFITGDTGAALRAKAAGLDVRKVPTPDPDAD